MKLKYNISHYLFPLNLSFSVTSKMQIANAIFIVGRLKLYKKYIINFHENHGHCNHPNAGK